MAKKALDPMAHTFAILTRKGKGKKGKGKGKKKPKGGGS